MTPGYQCDSCKGFATNKGWFIKCLGCGKEICGSCVDIEAHCNVCAARVPPHVRNKAYRDAYGD